MMSTVARSLRIAALILLLGAGAATADTAPPASEVSIVAPSSADTAEKPAATAQPAAEPLSTEVVFCIDCSGSMGQSLKRAQETIRGLINEMQAQTPDKAIRVGVIRYGTGSNALEVCPLTDKPEQIRSYIDRIQISGGAEFVGEFIKNAVEKMNWSSSNSYRKIYMVGNETTFQGPVDFRVAAKTALNYGFPVSAIYCPSLQDEALGDTARATATTRVLINGVSQTSGRASFARNMLDVEQSWLLTAYFGGGEVIKLSANPNRPLFRYSPDRVVELVDVEIPQKIGQMMAADAAFARLDQTGRLSSSSRQVPRRR